VSGIARGLRSVGTLYFMQGTLCRPVRELEDEHRVDPGHLLQVLMSPVAGFHNCVTTNHDGASSRLNVCY